MTRLLVWMSSALALLTGCVAPGEKGSVAPMDSVTGDGEQLVVADLAVAGVT